MSPMPGGVYYDGGIVLIIHQLIKPNNQHSASDMSEYSFAKREGGVSWQYILFSILTVI